MGGVDFLRTINYFVTEAEAGWTVEDFLKNQGISRRVIVALKKNPIGILQNGRHTRTIDILQAADILQLNLPESPKRIPLCTISVPILYEDEDIIVYNKPSGMPCHQSGGHIYDTLDGVYAAHCARTSQPESFRPINRLDKDTTGAVVAARNQLVAGKLWKEVNKCYIALVEGYPQPLADVIDLPLCRAEPLKPRRAVNFKGKKAITCYQVLAQGDQGSLVAFVLITGRTHQIRVHMAYKGWPLAGDSMYGKSSPCILRQALHCSWVTFYHPITGKQIKIEAPLPEDFIKLMKEWGIYWKKPDWETLFINQLRSTYQ